MELSKQAKEDLKFLGNFTPCSDGESFKGYMLDDEGNGGKVYLHESDFLNIAKSCIEAANYLAQKKTEKSS
jgi:hypothetical protein